MKTYILPTPALLTKHRRTLLRIEYFAVALIPVLLLKLRIIPPTGDNALFVLIGMFVLGAVIVSIRIFVTKTWSLEGTGILPHDFKKGWKWYILFLVLGGVIIPFAGHAVAAYKSPSLSHGISTSTLWLYSLGGSIKQEFLYRVYLMTLGKEIFSPKANIFWNVVLFTGMHCIFPTPGVIMAFVAPGAYVFAWFYNRYQNFPLIASLHVVFNALAVWVKVFR